MKKLIAAGAALALALAAVPRGAEAADFVFGGEAVVDFVPIWLDVEGSDIKATSFMKGSVMFFAQGGAFTPVGVFGGRAEVRGDIGAEIPQLATGAWSHYATLGAHGWWMPADWFWFGFGQGIGFFTGGLGRQEFHWNDSGVPISVGGLSHHAAFPEAVDTGASLEFLPFDGAAQLSIGVPYPMGKADSTDFLWGSMTRLRFNLGFGHFGFSYKMAEDGIGTFHGMIHVTAPKVLALDFGARLSLKDEEGYDDPHTLTLGLGANIDINESFGIRLRASSGLRLGEAAEMSPSAISFSVDVAPYYAISPGAVVALYG
ncbi:MAG: hypothetical protein FWE09_04730, partial [Treponema sp.]|nr:hypothetical protein [Treponema sp.]